MEKIALLTALFDYPENYTPTFYKNASKHFNSDDIHIVRNSGLITDGSYYDKLYFYKISATSNVIVLPIFYHIYYYFYLIKINYTCTGNMT